jgi:alpha-glucoside transport system permease protein
LAEAMSRRPAGLRSVLLPLGGILALVGLVLGLWILIDDQLSANLTAVLYDLIGDGAEANALRVGGGNRTVAKFLLAGVALAVGVGGIWLFYAGLNAIVETFVPRQQQRILPWVFVGPALVLLALFLVWPVVSTIIKSLTLGAGVGNYEWALTRPENHSMYFNNLLWLVVGVAGAVGLGLLIAALVDRVKHESLAKTFVFLPLAISLVGASVIWRFVYAWQRPGTPQYGLLNAIWTFFGGEPVPWIQTDDFKINTFLMIVILIWLQTGFCMVILSAAIKGVPVEITEASRLDGASERQLFFRVIVPMIKGTLATVMITTAIVVLKVFDIVYVMTGGRFDSNVVANEMYSQAFASNNYGRASALAVVLFVAVLPLLVVNIRNIRRQGLVA